jgi:hypothetical protein
MGQLNVLVVHGYRIVKVKCGSADGLIESKG